MTQARGVYQVLEHEERVVAVTIQDGRSSSAASEIHERTPQPMSPSNDDDDQLPLYTDLASWFHLLTAPEDYELDARHALDTLSKTIGEPPRTVLELGSGGGNSASHMKAHAMLTLTDLSEQMLELSRTINPEVEHLQGDMRTLRLGRRRIHEPHVEVADGHRGH